MRRLKLEEGDAIRIHGARLPKGKFVKLQPQHVNFLELSDPKAVLEQALRNFACLSVGDVIEIAHNSINFEFLIMEAQPSPEGINVIDTDLEVDFAPPVGYVEPTPQPRKPTATMASKLGIQVEATQEVDASGSGRATPTNDAAASGSGFSAFTGSGNSLAGKRVKGKGLGKKIEELEEGSLIRRTNIPRVVTNDTQIGSRHVPAALDLPHGHLFFGYNVLTPAQAQAAQPTRAGEIERERKRLRLDVKPRKVLTGDLMSMPTLGEPVQDASTKTQPVVDLSTGSSSYNAPLHCVNSCGEHVDMKLMKRSQQAAIQLIFSITSNIKKGSSSARCGRSLILSLRIFLVTIAFDLMRLKHSRASTGLRSMS